MKPSYTTVSLLDKRWLTKDLIQWSESQIIEQDQKIRKIVDENNKIYETSARVHQAQRDQFKREHPKSKLPHRLQRGVIKPPDLLTKWYTLLKRRQSELDRIAREQQEQAKRNADNQRRKERQAAAAQVEKRTTFLKRMHAGKYQAMARRESTIRVLVTATAQQQGIALTGKGTVQRLEQLLTTLVSRQERELA